MIFDFKRALPIRQCRRTYSMSLQHKTQFSSSKKIRETFLDYFIHKHDHTFVRSSPVVPFCDPTVPFVNAGMNQFKNVFLNKMSPPADRVANSQKCIRVSGKHNDLSIVGTDGYHHTFFEMLGNWSFGDYFKEKACRLAWDLLTGPYMIHPDRLYVTYFAGDDALRVPADAECYNIWRSIGVNADRILPFGARENFWEMGKVGPCGPCTEIHIDHLPNSLASRRARFVNADRPDLTELWNVVFIEYNRNLDGTVSLLPRKHIDTGMGMERLTAILQGKSSNYDTDLFTPIFDSIAQETKCRPYTGTFDATDPNYGLDCAYRILADHGRTFAISAADGLFPDQNNRLRKILCTALNIAKQTFGDESLLQKAVIPRVIEILGDTYPELDKNSRHINEVISFNNELFKAKSKKQSSEFEELQLENTMIDIDDITQHPQLIVVLRELQSRLKLNKTLTNLTGDDILALQNKFNVPGELIARLAEVKGLTADTDEFESLLAKQKAENAPKWLECLKVERNLNLRKTDNEHKYNYNFNQSTGQFEVPTVKAHILAVEKDSANEDLHRVITDKSNFYYTSGGQDSDIGQIISGQSVFNVESVDFVQGLVIHGGRFVSGSLRVGDEVELCVDPVRRTNLTRHHTATHILQAALKKVTGKIVYQVSSHVTPTSLRFHLGIVGDRPNKETLLDVENLMRDVIKSSTAVETSIVTVRDVYNCDRLTIVPGETYPDSNIRLVKIDSPDLDFFSLEPCCGTHVRNTSELEAISITECKRLSRRRQELIAVCGDVGSQAKTHEDSVLAEMDEIRKMVKEGSAPQALLRRMNKLKAILMNNPVSHTTKDECLKELKVMVKQGRLQQGASLGEFVANEMNNVLQKAKETKEAFIVHVFRSSEQIDPLYLWEARKQCGNLPAILISASKKKVYAIAAVPIDDLNEHFDARLWLGQLVSTPRKCLRPWKKDTHSLCSFRFHETNVKDAKLDKAVNRAKDYANKHFVKK